MEHTDSLIPVVIPAYEPDERLIQLITDMIEMSCQPIIVVDDGSGKEYEALFHKVLELIESCGGHLLVHDKNRGKGRALKTAFEYIINQYPYAIGCVTADSDGQHTPACIFCVAEKLKDNPLAFVLGVRNFNKENIPWKSQFGNSLTERVFAYVTGMHVSDTQTGLRGIPLAFMKELLGVQGERFEFETRMLMESAGQYPILEIPIETVYDSAKNHQTHFHPVVDSIKIYRILGEKFIKYVVSAVSSFVIDISLFSFFSYLLEEQYVFYAAIATVLARVISAAYNYFMNYKVVFKSKEKIGSSGFRYLALAAVQMGLSAILVTGGIWLLPIPKVVIKIMVDTGLFLGSYYIQRKYIF